MKNRDALATFELMPKRFLMWDQRRQKFMDVEPLTIDEIVCSNSIRERIGELDFIQSTNLFGKDNKEIFEGSIIENEDGDTAVIIYRRGAFVIQWVSAEYETYALDEVVTTSYKVVGHIFSNPELLEEEQ